MPLIDAAETDKVIRVKKILIASGVTVVVFFALGLAVEILVPVGQAAMTAAVISASLAFYFMWSRVLGQDDVHEKRVTVDEFVDRLRASPEQVSFQEVIDTIDKNYTFIETAFTNGDTHNHAGDNNGSCKIFAFGLLNQLTPEQTLHCFGDYYRVDVLQNPDGADHQNIRNFMKYGWEGIRFTEQALRPK